MVIPEPEKILNKRREIEAEILKHFDITTEDLAEYFNCPPKTIRKDLETITAVPLKRKPVNITILREKRDEELLTRIKSGENQEEVLSEYGLWRMPKDFHTPAIGSQLSKTTEAMPCSPEKKARCLALFEIGFTAADIYPQIDGLDAVSRAIFEQGLKKEGLAGKNYLHYDKEFQDTLSDTVKYVFRQAKEKGISRTSFMKTKEFDTIHELMGATRQETGRAAREDHREKSLLKKEEQNAARLAQMRAEKQKLREEIYRRWSSGEATQKELAEEYGLTRHTVMNYIETVKSQNLNVLAKELPTVRRRNSNASVREKVAAKKQKFLSFYHGLSEEEKETMSFSRMGQLTGMNDEDVRKFLLQENLIPVRYEKAPLLDIEKASAYSMTAYAKGTMALFGYGPNAGRTKREDKDEMLRHNREIQYGLDNTPAIRRNYNENRGDLTPYFVSRNPRAAEEYRKKYPERADRIQQEEMEMEV